MGKSGVQGKVHCITRSLAKRVVIKAENGGVYMMGKTGTEV